MGGDSLSVNMIFPHHPVVRGAADGFTRRKTRKNHTAARILFKYLVHKYTKTPHTSWEFCIFIEIILTLHKIACIIKQFLVFVYLKRVHVFL